MKRDRKYFDDIIRNLQNFCRREGMEGEGIQEDEGM